MSIARSRSFPNESANREADLIRKGGNKSAGEFMEYSRKQHLVYRRFLFRVLLTIAAVVILLASPVEFSRADLPGSLPTQTSPMSLTEAELAWLREHPSIRVYNQPDWPAFNFAEGGQPRGYSIDFLN